MSSLNFPPPPAGLTGWPWTLDKDRLPRAWSQETAPRLTIITPSFNHGRFIEETIRSIILQGYPNLEFLVFDGGSSDETRDILRKYDPWITRWVSESDGGQADAINKGLAQATGSIVAWCNSDDYYLQGAFDAVASAFDQSSDSFFAGQVLNFIDGKPGFRLVAPKGLESAELIRFWERKVVWHDPGLFFPKSVIDSVGLLDVSLRYAFDYDFLLRVRSRLRPHYLDRPVACFRLHEVSKTVAQGEWLIRETAEVSRRYWNLEGMRYSAHARRAVSEDLAVLGTALIVRGNSRGISLLGEALRNHPFASVRHVCAVVIRRVLRSLARIVGFSG
ncbi:MAG TPA: glycosyltransferase family 2 protein [Thermoanaerobaculia bacterium]|nr:glycosyltransferase family 2 protein [Thermoanaerobaculia bacterium]